MDIRRIIRNLVQEAYSAKHNANIYFPTFSEAVQHAREVAEKKGFVVDENDWFNQVTTGAGRRRESCGGRVCGDYGPPGALWTCTPMAAPKNCSKASS